MRRTGQRSAGETLMLTVLPKWRLWVNPEKQGDPQKHLLKTGLFFVDKSDNLHRYNHCGSWRWNLIREQQV